MSEALTEAAHWYAATPRDPSRRIIPTLCERFDLTPKQAVEVIRLSKCEQGKAEVSPTSNPRKKETELGT